jgi:hypothetical protein
MTYSLIHITINDKLHFYFAYTLHFLKMIEFRIFVIYQRTYIQFFLQFCLFYSLFLLIV